MTLNSMRNLVKMFLTKHHLTYAWLVAELDKKGVSTCTTDLSLYLTGKRVGKKASTVLAGALEIAQNYEATYAKA